MLGENIVKLALILLADRIWDFWAKNKSCAIMDVDN